MEVGLTQLVCEPTFTTSNNILDLSLVKNTEIVSEVAIQCCTYYFGQAQNLFVQLSKQPFNYCMLLGIQPFFSLSYLCRLVVTYKKCLS